MSDDRMVGLDGLMVTLMVGCVSDDQMVGLDG